MITLTIVLMVMVIFKRIPQETAKKEVLVVRVFIRFEALERPSRAILRHQIGPSTAANDFHGWPMCSWLWKFNSDGFCPFEKANPAAGSRMMPRWDMKNLGEKYRVSSWEIHMNEPVTNTKSGCEKCNSTDQRRDVCLDRNTQAATITVQMQAQI